MISDQGEVEVMLSLGSHATEASFRRRDARRFDILLDKVGLAVYAWKEVAEA
jgi:hypothetical protein